MQGKRKTDSTCAKSKPKSKDQAEDNRAKSYDTLAGPRKPPNPNPRPEPAARGQSRNAPAWQYSRTSLRGSPAYSQHSLCPPSQDSSFAKSHNSSAGLPHSRYQQSGNDSLASSQSHSESAKRGNGSPRRLHYRDQMPLTEQGRQLVTARLHASDRHESKSAHKRQHVGTLTDDKAGTVDTHSVSKPTSQPMNQVCLGNNTKLVSNTEAIALAVEFGG